jgi:hypothetical protein
MSAYKVGDRVEFARDGSAGCAVIGCVGTIIEVSESDEEGTQYLVKIDGWASPRWSEWTEFHENCVYYDENIDPSPTPPESRQSALNRLLAEHKERKAALEETRKAIEALLIDQTLRHRKTGNWYHVYRVRRTLYVDGRPLGHNSFGAVTAQSLEFVDDEAGDTP